MLVIQAVDRLRICDHANRVLAAEVSERCRRVLIEVHRQAGNSAQRGGEGAAILALGYGNRGVFPDQRHLPRRPDDHQQRDRAAVVRREGCDDYRNRGHGQVQVHVEHAVRH